MIAVVRDRAKRIARRVAPGLAHSQSLRLAAGREPEIGLLPRLAGRGTSIDVGANKGLYVDRLLRLRGDVVAFEPIPEMYEHLLDHYGSRARIERIALSEVASWSTLRVPSGNTSWASLATSNRLASSPASGVREIEVETRTLDSFGFDDVGFVKIDVEGHEESVLRGAELLLSAHLPNLLVEIEERHNPGSVDRSFSWLSDRGYTGFFLDNGTVRPVQDFVIERDQDPSYVGERGKVGRYINNFIFVRSSRRKEWLAG